MNLSICNQVSIFPFRFQVQIPENYPDGDVPKIVFENSVFHPSIDPVTHQLNVKQVIVVTPANLDRRFNFRDSTNGSGM